MTRTKVGLTCLLLGISLVPVRSRAQESVNRIEGLVYPIPVGTHSDSGYTAIECGLDGRVYVGTANYGASAHVVCFEPRTETWQDLFSAHDVTRETGCGLDSQSKFHAKIVVDADGVVWAATKQGNEQFIERPEYGENPTGYPGGHLFSYDPRTGAVRDHGILKKQEGLMGGAVDRKRRRLYYWSDPKQHFLIYDIERNTVRDLGAVGGSPRYIAIDPGGRVFGMGRPGIIWMYDPQADRLYDLAVRVQGPGEYEDPYVIVMSADGRKIFGVAVGGGRYVMEFDLASIDLAADVPEANGTIRCEHVCPSIPPPFEPADLHAGTLGKDGCFYFTNRPVGGKTVHLIRYDPRDRQIVDLGEVRVKGRPDMAQPYAQGACVGSDGTLYLKFIYYPYRILVFDKLTSPDRTGAAE